MNTFLKAVLATMTTALVTEEAPKNGRHGECGEAKLSKKEKKQQKAAKARGTKDNEQKCEERKGKLSKKEKQRERKEKEKEREVAEDEGGEDMMEEAIKRSMASLQEDEGRRMEREQ